MSVHVPVLMRQYSTLEVRTLRLTKVNSKNTLDNLQAHIPQKLIFIHLDGIGGEWQPALGSDVRDHAEIWETNMRSL
eukprot:6203585-Pleurochrysis_carterae.AAC.1